MRPAILRMFAIVCLLFAAHVCAQDCYIVLKVKGTIVNEGTGETLAKDSRVCMSDKISFGSKDAVAILYNSSNGRFTLKPDKTSESELSGIIKAVVADVLSYSHATVDTRGDETDLKKILKNNFCVIGSDTISADEDDYPLNAGQYFFIRYDLSGKTITSRLPAAEGSIVLDRKSVYGEGAEKISPDEFENVSLYYFNGKEIPVRTFRIRFPDTANVATELSAFADELRSSGKSNEEITDELLFYIYDVYGPFSNASVKRWLIKRLNLQ